MIVAAAWTPSDHFGMWQLIVAVLGLAFAGVQLWRTARATIQTARATEETARVVSRRLLSNDLLLLLPSLQGLEDDLDVAVAAGKRERTSRILLAYRRQALELAAQLKTDDALKSDLLVSALDAAATSATNAKGVIQGGSTDNLADMVALFRKKAAKVDAAVADLKARLQRGTEN